MEINPASLGTNIAGEKPAERLIAGEANPELKQAKDVLTAAVILNDKAVVSGNAEDTAILDVLKFLGFKPTQDNIVLLQTLMNKGFAVTEDNMNALNRAQKLTGLEPYKAIIFLTEDIKVNATNAEAIKKLVNGGNRLTDKLLELVDAIAGFPDKELSEKLIKLLGGTGVDGNAAKKTASLFDTGEISTKTQASEKDVVSYAASARDGAGGDAVSENSGLSEETQHSDKALPTGTQKTAEALQEAEDNTNNKSATVEEHFDPGKTSSERSDIISGEDDLKAIKSVKETLTDKSAGIPEAGNKKEQNAGMQVLKPPEEAEKLKTDNFKKAVMKKFALNIEKPDVNEIDRLLNDVKSGAEAVKKELGLLSLRDNPVYNAADDLTKNMDFLNSLKTKIYVQIPVVLNGERTDCDIYVFSDKRKKTAKGMAKSALVALDTANLDRVESYIVRNERSVSFQFRLKNENAEKLIRKHLTSLNDLLSKTGFTMESVSFCRFDEPFDIASQESDFLEPLPKYTGAVVDLQT